MKFRVDQLSRLTILFAGLPAPLFLFYSFSHGSKTGMGNFSNCFLIFLGLFFASVSTDNIFVLVFLWGICGLIAYLVIPAYDQESASTAKKYLIMFGASHAIMTTGAVMTFIFGSSANISDLMLETGPSKINAAFMAFMAGSLFKAGIFPFHSWLPSYTYKAPSAYSSFLPVFAEKLLGVYLLVRICHYIFIISDPLRISVLALGSLTIISCAMMGLIQSDYKKALGFNSALQGGYVVLGIGTGSVAGLIAALLYMLNFIIAKSGLLMVAGNMSVKTGTTHVSELGGFSKKMPLNSICAVILALSVCGFPPFGGFVPLLILYRDIIETGLLEGTSATSLLWVVWLAAAMAGTALSITGFARLNKGIFVGRKFGKLKQFVGEPASLIPPVLFSFLSFFVGLFTLLWLISEIFSKVTGPYVYTFDVYWVVAGLLIFLSIFSGFILYRAMETFSFPRKSLFFSMFYSMAYSGYLDLYYLFGRLIFIANRVLSRLHDGVLQTYLAWVIAGLILLLIIL